MNTETYAESPAAGGITEAVGAAIFDVHVAFTAYGDQADVRALDDLVGAGNRLQRLLPGYDPSSQTMPWERDEDEFYTELDLPGWFDAGIEVAYRIHMLDRRGRTVAEIAGAYAAAANAVSGLESWHPGYCVDHGTITS